jgi:hypothetical protein
MSGVLEGKDISENPKKIYEPKKGWEWKSGNNTFKVNRIPYAITVGKSCPV